MKSRLSSIADKCPIGESGPRKVGKYMALSLRRNRVRELREKKGLSGYDMQILSKVPAWKVYAIERGLQRARGFEKELIAKALEASVDQVFPVELRNSKEILECRAGSK